MGECVGLAGFPSLSSTTNSSSKREHVYTPKTHPLRYKNKDYIFASL